MSRWTSGTSSNRAEEVAGRALFRREPEEEEEERPLLDWMYIDCVRMDRDVNGKRKCQMSGEVFLSTYASLLAALICVIWYGGPPTCTRYLHVPVCTSTLPSGRHFCAYCGDDELLLPLLLSLSLLLRLLLLLLLLLLHLYVLLLLLRGLRYPDVEPERDAVPLHPVVREKPRRVQPERLRLGVAGQVVVQLGGGADGEMR